MLCCARCSQLSTIIFTIVTPDSGSTILFNIVDNCEQCGQQNIVQSCYTAGTEFRRVHTSPLHLYPSPSPSKHPSHTFVSKFPVIQGLFPKQFFPISLFLLPQSVSRPVSSLDEARSASAF